MQGSSLQHPQKVGAISHVHMGVWPPQEPPGDRLASDVERPAGRRISPKHPFLHGSAVQQPTNLVPVSHAYLSFIRDAHSRVRDFETDVPSTSTGTKELPWFRCRIARIRHGVDDFSSTSVLLTTKPPEQTTQERKLGLRTKGVQKGPQTSRILKSPHSQLQESQVFATKNNITAML
jgi:hypothetical protein